MQIRRALSDFRVEYLVAFLTGAWVVLLHVEGRLTDIYAEHSASSSYFGAIFAISEKPMFIEL
jgi:hypothetical protein